MDFNYFLSLAGFILVIEGCPYFLFPEKLKKFLVQVLDTPDSSLRILGLAAMLAGVLLLYLAKN